MSNKKVPVFFKKTVLLRFIKKSLEMAFMQNSFIGRLIVNSKPETIRKIEAILCNLRNIHKRNTLIAT